MASATNRRSAALNEGVSAARRRGACFVVPIGVALTFVAGCNYPVSTALRTSAPGTDGRRTAEAMFTQVGPTQGPTVGSGETSTGTSLASSPSVTSTGECTDRAAFVDDVTVRDNAEFGPGESFVKIWRLRNVGTCIWTQAYMLTFFGGERMRALALVPLPSRVAPGSTVDLSVDMEAPSAPRTYEGFWKLRNPAGVFFGIGPNGDQSFWVKIVVPPEPVVTSVISPKPTPTPSSTATPGADVTTEPTPVVLVEGTAGLERGSSFDLDGGVKDPAQGADIRLDVGVDGEPAFQAMNGAKLAVPAPTILLSPRETCQRSALHSEPISLATLDVRSQVCYQTDEGRYGYLEIASIQTVVVFAFTTWGP